MSVLLTSRWVGLAAQDLLGGLLLGFVVVGIPDQPVAHTVQHIDDVAEGLIHLAHGVVGGGLRHPTPAGTGNVLRRCPHLAGLVLHRLSVHIKTARHRPHLMRVSHKTSRHNSFSLLMSSATGALPAALCTGYDLAMNTRLQTRDKLSLIVIRPFGPQKYCGPHTGWCAGHKGLRGVRPSCRRRRCRWTTCCCLRSGPFGRGSWLVRR